MSRWRYALVLATVAVTGVALGAFVGRAVPLPVPLSELPFRVASWSGQAESIPPELLQRTRPDDAISRRYRDAYGGIVDLYVGYFAREASRAESLSACQGECTVLEAGNEALTTQNGRIVVTDVRVRQDATEKVVLYWFQYGHKAFRDVYRTRLDLAERTILQRRSDGALVRISSPIDGTVGQARDRCAAFAKQLFPLLNQYLPD